MQAGCLFDLTTLSCYKYTMRTVLIVWLLCLFAQLSQAVTTETNFAGVGIDGRPLPDGQIRVEQVVAAGPAHLAGIRVGDIITQIDGAATRGSRFQDLVQKRLRGSCGQRR